MFARNVCLNPGNPFSICGQHFAYWPHDTTDTATAITIAATGAALTSAAARRTSHPLLTTTTPPPPTTLARPPSHGSTRDTLPPSGRGRLPRCPVERRGGGMWVASSSSSRGVEVGRSSHAAAGARATVPCGHHSATRSHGHLTPAGNCPRHPHCTGQWKLIVAVFLFEHCNIDGSPVLTP